MSQLPDVPLVLPLVSVIGHEFIAPYPLEFKLEKYSKESLVITDINNKIILKVKPCDSSIHSQRLLLDANDRPIVKLREKNMSGHKRWEVFRGESKADSDMIFSMKNEHAITQSKNICVNVYMANKTNSKGDYDFRIKGNWSNRSCTVYMGDSSTTLAQMNPVQSLETNVVKDKFMVTISPNVDYAFVVALIAIIDAMKNFDTRTKEGVAAGGVGGGLVAIGAIISS